MDDPNILSMQNGFIKFYLLRVAEVLEFVFQFMAEWFLFLRSYLLTFTMISISSMLLSFVFYIINLSSYV